MNIYIFLVHLDKAYDSLRYLYEDLDQFLSKEIGFGDELKPNIIKLENNLLYIAEILKKIYYIAEETNNINFPEENLQKQNFGEQGRL